MSSVIKTALFDQHAPFLGVGIEHHMAIAARAAERVLEKVRYRGGEDMTICLHEDPRARGSRRSSPAHRSGDCALTAFDAMESKRGTDSAIESTRAGGMRDRASRTLLARTPRSRCGSAHRMSLSPLCARAHRRATRQALTLVHRSNPHESRSMLHQRPRSLPVGLDHCVLPDLDPKPTLPALPTHERFPWDPFAPKPGP